MDFRPVIGKEVQTMDSRIFEAAPMGIRNEMLELSLEERLTYDPGENLFFVNFEGFSVKSSRDVAQIEAAVSRILEPLGRQVYTIVNYDNFFIAPDLIDEYTDMVKGLVDRYYSGVTRYTTSTFLRMKIGVALKKRKVAPHIYESRDEARKALTKEKK
jgi:propionate CoA-transferase